MFSSEFLFCLISLFILVLLHGTVRVVYNQKHTVVTEINMYVMGRVHDPEHGIVGVASKAGFYSINEGDTRDDRPHD